MEGLSTQRLLTAFPFAKPRDVQTKSFKLIEKEEKGLLEEIPTGEGKTVIGMTALLTLSKQKRGPLFYVTPTKPQVNQIAKDFAGSVSVIYGRAEYPCFYYGATYDKDGHVVGVTAEESPCYMVDCKHRVNQETGETEEPGVEPCPYYYAKYRAKTEAERGKIIVCTTAFFLVNRRLVDSWRKMEPDLVVVDEVHNLAKVARSIFEYTLTEYHLFRVADFLEPLAPKEASIIREFAGKVKQISYNTQAYQPTLLKDEHLENLISILEKSDVDNMEKIIRQAVKKGQIDPITQKGELKTLENMVLRIPKLIHSLRYSLEEKGRNPLNYVIAFYYKVDDPRFSESQRKARFFLTIKSYFVVPLITRTLGERIIAYSATIGDPDVLKFETGIDLPFYSFNSTFDVSKTRVFMPTDTPNLALKKRRRNDLGKSLKMIATAAKTFSQKGLRSLVLVVSEMERQKFLKIAEEIGLETITYGNGIKRGEAVERFKAGEGQVLVGTAAAYGEGIDLPENIAPVIFFLRPGYASPKDPEAQFEERRFSEGHVWALRNWRVMIEALQVRGRNIRGLKDVGVCFFISQGFRRIVFGSLPDWLKPAYRGETNMDKAVKETLDLLT